jgi:hypothetical protein
MNLNQIFLQHNIFSSFHFFQIKNKNRIEVVFWKSYISAFHLIKELMFFLLIIISQVREEGLIFLISSFLVFTIFMKFETILY